MRRALAWILRVAVLSYLGFGVLLYAGQREMMYLPVPENPASDLAVERVTVDDAVDGDGVDPHLPARPYHAQRDLAAVGYEYLLEHAG